MTQEPRALGGGEVPVPRRGGARGGRRACPVHARPPPPRAFLACRSARASSSARPSSCSLVPAHTKPVGPHSRSLAAHAFCINCISPARAEARRAPPIGCIWPCRCSCSRRGKAPGAVAALPVASSCCVASRRPPPCVLHVPCSRTRALLVGGKPTKCRPREPGTPRLAHGSLGQRPGSPWAPPPPPSAHAARHWAWPVARSRGQDAAAAAGAPKPPPRGPCPLQRATPSGRPAARAPVASARRRACRAIGAPSLPALAPPAVLGWRRTGLGSALLGWRRTGLDWARLGWAGLGGGGGGKEWGEKGERSRWMSGRLISRRGHPRPPVAGHGACPAARWSQQVPGTRWRASNAGGAGRRRAAQGACTRGRDAHTHTSLVAGWHLGCLWHARIGWLHFSTGARASRGALGRSAGSLVSPRHAAGASVVAHAQAAGAQSTGGRGAHEGTGR